MATSRGMRLWLPKPKVCIIIIIITPCSRQPGRTLSPPPDLLTTARRHF